MSGQHLAGLPWNYGLRLGLKLKKLVPLPDACLSPHTNLCTQEAFKLFTARHTIKRKERCLCQIGECIPPLQAVEALAGTGNKTAVGGYGHAVGPEHIVPALWILHLNKQLLGRKNTTAENGQTETTVTY